MQRRIQLPYKKFDLTKTNFFFDEKKQKLTTGESMLRERDTLNPLSALTAIPVQAAHI